MGQALAQILRNRSPVQPGQIKLSAGDVYQGEET